MAADGLAAVRLHRPNTVYHPVRVPLSLPDKPSIAVLPFQNMSGDPEQEYFVDGMVEEIITALSRIRWLFVIARNSSFTYKGQAVDVKQVGRELGVRYVLEGSFAKAAIGCASRASSSMPKTARISGPTTSTDHWKTSSISRTKWPPVSRALLSRHCKPPRPSVRRPARPTFDRLRPLSACLCNVFVVCKANP